MKGGNPMKRKRVRLTALIMTLGLCISMVSISAAETVYDGDNCYTYAENNDTEVLTAEMPACDELSIFTEEEEENLEISNLSAEEETQLSTLETIVEEETLSGVSEDMTSDNSDVLAVDVYDETIQEAVNSEEIATEEESAEPQEYSILETGAITESDSESEPGIVDEPFDTYPEIETEPEQLFWTRT